MIYSEPKSMLKRVSNVFRPIRSSCYYSNSYSWWSTPVSCSKIPWTNFSQITHMATFEDRVYFACQHHNFFQAEKIRNSQPDHSGQDRHPTNNSSNMYSNHRKVWIQRTIYTKMHNVPRTVTTFAKWQPTLKLLPITTDSFYLSLLPQLYLLSSSIYRSRGSWRYLLHCKHNLSFILGLASINIARSCL